MVVARGDTNRTIELGPSRRPVIGLPLCQSRPTFGRLAPTGLLPSGPNQLPVRLEHAPDLTQLAWIRHAVDIPAGATSELPTRGWRPLNQGRDLLEREVEHIMQYEDDALGGGHALQDDQQRHAHALVQCHDVSRV